MTTKISDKWGDNIPVLVLIERPDHSVTGVVLRCHYLDNSKVAEKWCEPSEVEGLLIALRGLTVGESFMTTETFKELDLDAPSLEEAVLASPESDVGQKEILVYKDCEWFTDIWSNPGKNKRSSAGQIHLMSVADFHGTRVSQAKRQQRAGLAVALEKQVLAGDYAVFEEALRIVGTSRSADCEQNPAVQLLCNWWNANAPEDMRTAGLFRVYRWDDQGGIFLAGDPEEPATQANQMASSPAYAVFEKEGRPTVVVQFFRGRAYNTEDAEGVRTYYANGESGWVHGCSLSDVDEAHYSVKGLRNLRKHLTQSGTARGYNWD